MSNRSNEIHAHSLASITTRASPQDSQHVIRYGSVETSPSDAPLSALEASVTALREDLNDVFTAGSLLDYLTPFLDIVKSPETSGRLTSAALLAVQRILDLDLIGSWRPGGAGAGMSVGGPNLGNLGNLGNVQNRPMTNPDDVHVNRERVHRESVSSAMRSIAEAVTQCKFESSRTDQDECVLDRILDVFTALIRSPQSGTLRHEDVVGVFQACYRIGHMRTERGKHSSAMLTQSSQRAMVEVVGRVFGRVGRGELVEYERKHGEREEGGVAGSKSPLSVVSRQLVGLEDDDEDDEGEGVGMGTGGGARDGEVEVESRKREGEDGVREAAGHGHHASVASAEGRHDDEGNAKHDEKEKQETQEDKAAAAGGDTPPPQPVTVSLSMPGKETNSVPSPSSADADKDTPQTNRNSDSNGSGNINDDDRDSRPQQQTPRPNNSSPSYGVPALAEMLAFIISMIGSKPSKHYPELPLAGLELVTTCIRACVSGERGAGLAAMGGAQSTPPHALPPSLMGQLKQDLFRALFSAASHGVHQSRSLAAICQVGILLYVLYRDVMLPQIEALVSLLILPVAESSKHLLLRRTALEGLLDFCRQPGFLATTYVNCDCRIGGAGGIGDGLFKRICDVISGSAKVTDEEGVFKFHGVAVEGIRTVFDAISNIREVGDRHDRHDRHGHGHGHVRNLSRDGSGLATAREYVDIWTPLCAGELLGDSDSSGAGAWSAASEKELMILMGSAAEQFNKHQKKGMEYCQEIKLLPTPLTARAVARFLRGCPGLSKAAIGEVLGERDQFYEEIREEFCDTFNFGGLRFDVALRLFMDAFRPPGEGQKIDRIVQSFGKKYYEQVPKSGLKSADAAYVLAFSVIMLNTDLHNTQNKRKMTLEDFGRINRNTNEGDPMPPELLSSIYAAISIDEFKISAECSAADLSHQSVFWATLAEASTKPRGRPVDDMTMFRALHEMRRDIFADAWVPALGAISAILAASPNPKTVKNATTALFVAAELGYRHKIEKVIDQVLDTLVKYTSALDYPDQASSSTTKPALAYGASIKARSSVETMFKIADLYGDSMKSGWACIVSTVMKVFAAELLTPEIILVDGESMEEAAERMPKPRPRNKGQSGSIFARAINSLISIEADGDLEYANAGGEMLRDMAKKSISSCSIESLVNDSKFLIVESLIELISALIASGKDSIAQAEAHAEGGASGAAPTDTAELALELLFSLSLRNRDRMTLFWPRIHEFLATCTRQESASIEGFAVLNKRAIEGLMRICQRLLPYKEDTADILLGSLSLVGEMHPRIVWELAPSISTELITLLSQSAPHIRTETGWRTIAILIRISASREEVLPYSLQALQLACQNPRAVSTESYIPLLETCLQLIDGFKATNPNIAAEFLECADALFAWLSSGDKESSTNAATANATVLDLWLTSVGILTKGLCRESSEKLRHTSIEALHRTLIGSSSLNLPPDMWVQTLRELVLPLVSDFAKAIPAASKKRLLPGATKSLQMSIDMVTSVLSKYAAAIAGDGDFGELTRATFVVLSECEAAAAGVKDKATVAMIQERVKTLQSLPSLQEGGGSDDSVAANGAGPAGSPTTSPPATTTATVAPPTAPTTAAPPTAPAANGIAGETENNVASLNQEEPPTCQQS